MQIHLDQFGNFGQLAINVCVTVSHNVAFNNINSKNDTKWNKTRQTPKWNIQTNFCQQSFQNIMQLHARYVFQLEDLFQCLQLTNLWRSFV